jgi:hypothetical protein
MEARVSENYIIKGESGEQCGPLHTVLNERVVVSRPNIPVTSQRATAKFTVKTELQRQRDYYVSQALCLPPTKHY